MLSPSELDAIEGKLHAMMDAANDTGGVSVLEAADYAVRSCWRLLHEYRKMQRVVLNGLDDAISRPLVVA